MKLLIASSNAGKVHEFKTILKDYFDEILSYADYGESFEVEETGVTFQQNAKKKAIQVSKQTGMWVLGDDTGLVVDALGGAPGVYSARYSRKGDDESNMNKLLQKMQGVPEEKRTARFVCALSLCDPDTLITLNVTGACEGLITEKPIGNKGFGYDPVFYYPPMELTFAQMTEDEKNRVSHRRNAADELVELLAKKRSE